MSHWRLIRAYLRAYQSQVADVRDDQCHWLGHSCRVVPREEVEGGVRSEGGSPSSAGRRVECGTGGVVDTAVWGWT